uniref:FAM20 C-terminal domain-containing protein n=1 Tax=Sphaeramia orbicularis TaxID=375764 RepID=A0A672Y9U3_9TELE
MVRRVMGRSTRSIYLSLACLSLALHILLAFFCLSVLQTACVPPTSSSSSSLHKLNASTLRHKWKDSRFGEEKEGEKKPSRGGNGIQKVRDQSKLEALFKHPLYNLPHPELQEDDWLLRVKTDDEVKETKSEEKEEEEEEEEEEKEEEDGFTSDSEWKSINEEKGYDKVTWTRDMDTHPPWLRFHLGITRWELYDRKDPTLVQVMDYMATQRILSTVQKTGGTQLKLLISFPNYGEALAKPMKQSRDAETDVNLFYFSDFERHNAEIAAFHLDRVLGFNRIPPVVGRLINVTREIRDITTDHKLSRTFFISPVGNVCFHGVCDYYCTTEHPVCGRPHALEVSLAAMLPDLTLAPRRSWRSPWRRSYSRTKQAQWETNPAYCDKVKDTPPYNQGTRLVDLIDMAILDFLMSNMDRHHYETFEKFGNETFLLHLDNGRAFGRHSRDEPSILAPLQQCCRIRRSTLLRLHLLSSPSFRLSDVMRESLAEDPLSTVASLLSEPHLHALDRRLAAVLQVVQKCQDLHKDVIYNDMGEYDQLQSHLPTGQKKT